MRLEIISVPEQVSSTIEINEDATVKELKEMLPQQQVRLIYAGKLLDDSAVLKDVIKEDNAFIHSVKPLGSNQSLQVVNQQQTLTQPNILPTLTDSTTTQTNILPLTNSMNSEATSSTQDSVVSVPTQTSTLPSRNLMPASGTQGSGASTLPPTNSNDSVPIQSRTVPIPQPTNTQIPIHSGLPFSYSLVPITPRTIQINGMFYRLETSPGVLLYPMHTTNNTQPQNIAQHNLMQPPQDIAQQAGAGQPRLNVQILNRAFQVRINMEIVWLVVKLSLAVVLFSRNGTWARTVFLGLVAAVLFLVQTGGIGIPAFLRGLQELMVGQRQGEGNPQGNANPGNQDQVPPANPEQGNPEVVNPNGQGLANDQPMTLLGLISWIVVTFFSSMVPNAAQA